MPRVQNTCFFLLALLLALGVVVGGGGVGCDSSTENCKTSNGKICNDHGRCMCGVCVCTDSYTGSKCEEFQSGPGKCGQFKDCVQCKVWYKGPLGVVECFDQCDPVLFLQPVDSLSEPSNREYKNCRYLDEDHCLYQFQVKGTLQGMTSIDVVQDLICTDPKYDIEEEKSTIVDTTHTSRTTNKVTVKSTSKPEEVEPVIGEEEGKTTPTSGGTCVTTRMTLVVIPLLFLFFLILK